MPQTDGTLLPETHSFQEYGIYIDNFYNTACSLTATCVGDSEALNELKVAAYLCIRCLEEKAGMSLEDIVNIPITDWGTNDNCTNLCVWLHDLEPIVKGVHSAVEYNQLDTIIHWFKRLSVQLIRCFNVCALTASNTVNIVNKRDGVTRSK